MKNTAQIKAFITGIFLSSLLAFPLLMDITLTPRFIALAVCCLLSAWFIFSSGEVKLKGDPILLSYGAYTLFCLLSITWSHTKSESIFEASKQALCFTVFALTVFSMREHRDYFLRLLMRASILLFFIAFLFAAIQLARVPHFNKEALYAISGINGHKNLFASFLFLNLFFLVRSLFHFRSTWKVLAGIAIVLSLTTLFLLQTKAIWIGLATAGFIFGFSFALKKWPAALSLNAFVIIIAALILSNLFFFKGLQPLIQKSIHYTSQINAAAGGSGHTMKLEEERLILWDKTYHMIAQRPWFGAGMGNWQIYFPDATLTSLYRAEDLNYTFQRPHNDFLWILAETGIVGLNLFLLFLFTLLFQLFKALSPALPDKLSALDIRLCLAFITGYFTISFFDFPKERMEHNVWINIILGMGYCLAGTYKPWNLHFERRIGTTFAWTGLLVLLLISYTGFMRLNGEFFTRRMYIYKQRGDLLNVISSGNSALSFAYSIDPTSLPICWYTGNAQASLGNFEAARRDFQAAYKLSPFNRNVLNDLGSSYVFTNDVIAAKSYYEEAARISPRFDEPKLNLAAMYINARDFATADKWLKSILHDSERRSSYQKLVDLQK